MKTRILFAPEGGDGGDKKDELLIDTKNLNLDDTSELDRQIDELVNVNEEPTPENDIETTPSDPPETDKDITDDTELDEEPVADEPEKNIEEDVVPEKTDDPPLSPEKDKEPTDKADTGVITEEYIKTLGLTPELATKLNKFIGKPIQEAIKSLAHAQTLIGKKKEDLLKQTDDVDKPAKVDIPAQQIKQAQTPDEIAQAKDDLIYNELLKDFPELPKDPVERKQFLTDLNYEDPERFHDYRDKNLAIKKDVDEVWRQTVYLRENHDKIIDQQVKETTTSIEGYLRDTLKVSPKDLGYDFTLDEKGDNEVISRLLSDPKNPNEFDPRVLTNYNGVTLINKEALYNKFILTEAPNIVAKLKSSARKEGFTSATQKQVAPSMATQAIKGKENKELKTDRIKEMNDVSDIDRMLDELEK